MSSQAVPSWRRKLAIQKANVKQALRSEDLTYFHIRTSLSRYHDADSKAIALLDDTDPTTEKLNNLNVGATVENELAFGEYKQDTEALKGEKDKATWHTKMEEAKERAKKRVIEAIDLTYDGAADIIEQLPGPTQDAAFNIFDRGQEFVMNAFSTFVGEMKAVIDQIVNFMKGIWTAMVEAWNTVVGAVTTAIDWIRNIFGVGSNQPARPERVPGTDGTTGGSSSEDDAVQNVSVSFKLQWLSNPPLAQVGVDWAIDYLDGQIDLALNNAFLAMLGNSYQVPGGWQCDGIVLDVPEAQVFGVIQAVKAVIRTEDQRRVPLGIGWANVPTPDPVMYFNAFSIDVPSKQPSQLGLVRKNKRSQQTKQDPTKTGAPLPTAMRQQAIVANGH